MDKSDLTRATIEVSEILRRNGCTDVEDSAEVLAAVVSDVAEHAGIGPGDVLEEIEDALDEEEDDDEEEEESEEEDEEDEEAPLSARRRVVTGRK